MSPRNTERERSLLTDVGAAPEPTAVLGEGGGSGSGRGASHDDGEESSSEEYRDDSTQLSSPSSETGELTLLSPSSGAESGGVSRSETGVSGGTTGAVPLSSLAGNVEVEVPTAEEEEEAAGAVHQVSPLLKPPQCCLHVGKRGKVGLCGCWFHNAPSLGGSQDGGGYRCCLQPALLVCPAESGSGDTLQAKHTAHLSPEEAGRSTDDHRVY